jgi:hypothetical protein
MSPQKPTNVKSKLHVIEQMERGIDERFLRTLKNKMNNMNIFTTFLRE